MEEKPSRMFEALRACGALARIMPELDVLFGVPQPVEHHPEIDTGVHVMRVVDYAAAQGWSLPVRFAALTHDLGKGTTPRDLLPRHIGHEERGVDLLKGLCQRLRVPNDCRELALVTARFHGEAHRALELRPNTIVKLLLATDALRQPGRFEGFLEATTADYCGRPGYEDRVFEPAVFLRQALQAAASVDAGAVAKAVDDPGKIKERVYEARVAAVKMWMEGR
jgi:tRNA nucleotidyltransferase (CCA-adding enzyme)